MHCTASRPLSWLLAPLAVVLGLMVLAAPAESASYRGWSVFERSGTTWTRAADGSTTVPADGSVIGWRLSLAAPEAARGPRGSVTFDQACKGTDATSGRKRVAVVIDYGRRVDYDDQGQPPVPRADCASVTTSATAADALADVARARVEDDVVCAVDDFPQSGCGDQVADADVPSAAQLPDAATSVALPAAATADDRPRDDGGLPLVAWAGVVVVLAGGALGLLTLRRRRAQSDQPE